MISRRFLNQQNGRDAEWVIEYPTDPAETQEIRISHGKKGSKLKLTVIPAKAWKDPVNEPRNRIDAKVKEGYQEMNSPALTPPAAAPSQPATITAPTVFARIVNPTGYKAALEEAMDVAGGFIVLDEPDKKNRTLMPQSNEAWVLVLGAALKAPSALAVSINDGTNTQDASPEQAARNLKLDQIQDCRQALVALGVFLPSLAELAASDSDSPAAAFI